LRRKAPTMNRLRAWRQKHRVTQRDVAALVGRSIPMISLLESGGRQLRPLEKVRYARALGASVAELFPPEHVRR